MRMDASGKKRLALLARKVSSAQILCTHERLREQLLEAGFTKVSLQPCPFIVPEKTFEPGPFQQLIAPGEARPDKNLGFLSQIITWLRDHQAEIPLFLQAAPNHHGEFAPDILKQLNAIESIGYPSLTMAKSALSEEAYLGQFHGAICLQPYRPQDYAGKISGITLDALARGAPCIATRGTWPAEIVEEFGAGIVCEENDVEAWGRAIEQAVAEFPQLQRSCKRAYDALSERHHPKRTLETILGV
ncbi:MAG: glycosyltransferase family 1 protein [Bacteroidetes bacterium]|nr:MAG: glycosyltransferase family 1 protein [Bacteroidota bacterium]